MASGSSSHSAKYPIFSSSIEKLFGNWQALQLAVENGQGGSYGKEIAMWMRQAVEEYFYQNEDLDGDEVSEFIGTLMDQELDTIVDDNSLEALGETLVQHFKLAASGKHSELQQLFNKLDEELAKPKPKATRQNNQEDDDESSEGSDDDDEDMEVDDPSTSTTANQEGSSDAAGPSQHRTGKNFVTEPDDDGWVTVTKPKKR